MATQTTSITFQMRLDNYAVVELLRSIDLEVGQTVTISGCDATLNGTQTVRALPPYLFIGVDTEGDLLYDENIPIANQVLFYDTGADIERIAVLPVGALTYTQTCTWITSSDIEAWLGISLVSAGDATFLTQCASAANSFAYKRRVEAGYVDSLTVSPSGDVTLGTIMYGGALFRQRSSINDFASFSDMATTAPTGLSPIIKQLLGIPRPAAA
jgi:hypothetical protein